MQSRVIIMIASNIATLATPRKSRARRNVAAGLAAVILVIVTALAVVPSMAIAPQPTEQNLQGEPDATEPVSYIIFKDGSSFLAKNGSTGAIDFMSHYASEVIQAAADALDGVGGTILIKAGTYNISSPINLHNNTILSGEGGGNRGYDSPTILAANESLDYVVGATLTQRNYGITVENMRIVGYYTSVARGIYIPYAMYCTIKDVFEHGARIGIELGGPTNGFESNDVNFIISCETRGDVLSLYHEPDTVGIYLRSNDAYISDCISGYYYTAYKFGGQGNIFFNENHVNLAGNIGLEVGYGTWYLRITDCEFDTIIGTALMIYQSSHVVVDGCSFFNNQREAIHVMGSSQVTISDSNFNDNGKGINGTYHDIWVDSSSKIIISGNTFVRSQIANNGTLYAVNIPNNCNNVTVTGNAFTNYVNKPVCVQYPYYDVLIDENQGYVLHAQGTAVMKSGQYYVVVNTGTSPYSFVRYVQVTGSSLETRDLWVDNFAWTTFNIYAPSAVTEDTDIYWEVWGFY